MALRYWSRITTHYCESTRPCSHETYLSLRVFAEPATARIVCPWIILQHTDSSPYNDITKYKSDRIKGSGARERQAARISRPDIVMPHPCSSVGMQLWTWLAITHSIRLNVSCCSQLRRKRWAILWKQSRFVSIRFNVAIIAGCTVYIRYGLLEWWF